MKRIVFFSLAMFASCSHQIAFGQEPGKYVRKEIKPDYFIPQKELDHTPKLPPIRYHNQNMEFDRNPVQRADILSIIREVDDTPVVSEEEGEIPISDMELSLPLRNYLDYERGDFNKIPQYKQKYDDYIKDLNDIGKTGKAPENEALKQDLAKMSSDERILLKD